MYNPCRGLVLMVCITLIIISIMIVFMIAKIRRCIMQSYYIELFLEDIYHKCNNEEIELTIEYGNKKRYIECLEEEEKRYRQRIADINRKYMRVN